MCINENIFKVVFNNFHDVLLINNDQVGMESSIQFRRMVQEVYHQSTYLTNRAIKYNGY